MLDQHGMSGHPATLRVEDRHAPFLRDTFEIIRDGRLGDLAQPFDSSSETLERIRAYADTCGRIIDGIDRGEISANPEVRAALVEEAVVNDEANEYERAVREHEAFAHLLRQLDGHRGEGDRHDSASHVRRQQVLLDELLVPPSYGGFIAELACAIRATISDTEAAAAALEDKGLAGVGEGYAAASGVAMNFDELRPTIDSGGRQQSEGHGG